MKISFENYKLFRQRQSIELKPLTILVGTNNSGKSSFTKLLLLLYNAFKQSYIPDLILNTDILNLGITDNVISSNSNSTELNITLNDSIKLTFTPVQNNYSEISKERLILKEITIDNKIKIFPNAENIAYDIKEGIYCIPNENDETKEYKEIETLFKIEIIDYKISNKTETDVEDIESQIKEINKAIQEIKEVLNNNLDDNLRKIKENELSSLNNKSNLLLEKINKLQNSNTKSETQTIKLYYINYNNEYNTTTNELDTYLDEALDLVDCNIKKTFKDFNYVLLNNTILEEDKNSIENLVEEGINKYLLTICKFIKLNFLFSESVIRLKKRLILFDDTKTKSYLKKYLEKQLYETKESFNSFKQGFIDSLNLFDDTINDIDIKIVKGTAFEILINGRNINDYGDGIKNIFALTLPILLNTNNTFLIEEPEIRLHPKSQSNLADFFLSQLNNNNFIIETHSEYFIRKLQLLILQKKQLKENVAIYYFERNGIIREIVISENASISDFGEGFFDEASNLLLDLIIEQSKINA